MGSVTREYMSSMRSTFRTTLLRMLFGLLLVAVGSTALVAWINGSFAVRELSDKLLDQTAARVEARLTPMLQEARDQGMLTARFIEAGMLQPSDCDSLQAYWKPVLEVNERLNYLSYTREADGQYCDVHRMAGGDVVLDRYGEERNGTDQRTRPYYVAAERAGRGTWLDAYVFFNAGVDAPGVTYSTPVYREDGALHGVITADFHLEEISNYLATVGVGAEGAAFVVEERTDGELRVLAHPDHELLVRPIDPDDPLSARDLVLASEMGDPRVAHVLQQSRDWGARSSLRFVHEGEPYLAAYRRLSADVGPGLNWYIGAYLPEREVMSRIEHATRQTGGVILMSLLLALLVGTRLASVLSRALHQLAEDAAAIADFDLDRETTPSSHILELHRLAEAMEHMKRGLRGYRRYLPINLVRVLQSEQREPELGSEMQEVTVYFSDVRGFSAISEKTHPTEMARMLGRYLGAHSDVIRAHEGTVVQYVGDEIMAFWNAPAPLAEHGLAACRAALACVRLDAQRKAAGGPDWDSRFGVHTAHVAVGHFGSPTRLYYGAIGDGVNLASRLEGLNKFYRTSVLISAATQARVCHALVCRPVDRVAVKGREEGLMVYELLGERGDEDADAIALAEAYGGALEHYFARNWEDCVAELAALMERWPDDGPAAVLHRRCVAFQADPPGPSWDGVYRLQVK